VMETLSASTISARLLAFREMASVARRGKVEEAIRPELIKKRSIRLISDHSPCIGNTRHTPTI
jgi:hypothetical protein